VAPNSGIRRKPQVERRRQAESRAGTSRILGGASNYQDDRAIDDTVHRPNQATAVITVRERRGSREAGSTLSP